MKKLSDMRENETVLIEYAYLNSFAVDDSENMQIRLERAVDGWRAQCMFVDRSTGKPSTLSLSLALELVKALDAAIAPKVYGEDDLQLSGEHIIELHWSNGEHHKIRKTGDDDHFMKLIWRLVTGKEQPNQPVQSNAVWAPRKSVAVTAISRLSRRV